MFRIRNMLLTAVMVAEFAAFAEVQAQIFYRPSASTRFVPQNRTTFGMPGRVFANNGIRYQTYPQNYGQTGQTTVYSNGSYTVQPNGSYIQSEPTYYAQPNTPYYYGSSNSYPVHTGDQFYSNQPSNVYSSNYGSGYYTTPQQAANANAGAIIGNAIGGVQGAQFGAAIGSAIRP